MRSYYEDRTKMNTVFWARIGWFSFLRNVSYLFWGAWFSTYSHQDSNRVHLLLNIHLSVYKEVEPTFCGQIAIWLTTTLACFHLFSLFNHHSGRLQELNHVKSKCLQLETVQTQFHHPFSQGCSCKKSHGFSPWSHFSLRGHGQRIEVLLTPEVRSLMTKHLVGERSIHVMNSGFMDLNGGLVVADSGENRAWWWDE